MKKYTLIILFAGIIGCSLSLLCCSSDQKQQTSRPAGSAVTENQIIAPPSQTISGRAAPNSTVRIYVDGVLTDSTIADSSGNWSKVRASTAPSVSVPLSTGTPPETDIPGQSVEEEIATIHRLETELIDYYRRGDTSGLNRLLDEEYSIGLPNGRGFGNKHTEVGGIKGPIPQGFVLRNDSLTVYIRGTMAVVTKLLIQQGVNRGRNVDSKSVWTDVWIKKESRWWLLSSHGTYLAVDSYVY